MHDRILLQCRNMVSEPKEHLHQVDSLDFSKIEAWVADARNWGYILLPEWLSKILLRIRNKQCYLPLYLKIAHKLHYPSLRCAAFSYMNTESLENILKLILKGNYDSCMMWSALEIWVWALNNTGNSGVDRKEWLNEVILPKINEVISIIVTDNHIFDLQRWLFADSHRENMRDEFATPICFLIESVIVWNWKNSFFDEASLNIDYLTFVAQDVNDHHALPEELARKVLTGYDRTLREKKVFLKLDFSKNEIDRINGYAKVFSIVNKDGIIVAVKECLQNYECHFEGWQSKSRAHDYNDKLNYAYITAALACLPILETYDQIIKDKLSDILIDAFVRIVHLWDSDFEKLLMTVWSIRYMASKTGRLEQLDETMIWDFRDLVFVIKAFCYSAHSCDLNSSNKNFLETRWKNEYDALKSRYLTTGETDKLNDLRNMVKKLGLD